MSTPSEIESRLRALESRDDDREALRRRLESALARADALERELAALREQHAKAEALYDEQMAMRLRAEEILGATNWENTDHAAERVMKELSALRASPSPSAGAVPEVWLDDLGGLSVGEEQMWRPGLHVDDEVRRWNAWFAKHWPKPHADAGGEIEDVRRDLARALAERDAARKNAGEAGASVCRERLRTSEAIALCNAALAAGLAECERLRHELHCVRNSYDDVYDENRWLRERTDNVSRRIDAAAEAARRDEREACARECDAEEKWFLDHRLGLAEALGMQRCARRIRARAAEREKTSEGKRELAPGNGTRSTSSPAEAPQEPGAIPAPTFCTVCGASGQLPAPSDAFNPSGRTRCPACSGTGRAPASFPAPAAPARFDSDTEPCDRCGKPRPYIGCVSEVKCYEPCPCPRAPAAPEARGGEDEANEVLERVRKFLHIVRTPEKRRQDFFMGAWKFDTWHNESLSETKLFQMRAAIYHFVRAERALARDAALEEAAKACEALISPPDDGSDVAREASSETAHELAARIRSLRGKAESGEGGA